MKYPFRNLVFEGGGVKGIAYAGAMEVLESKNILQQITRVGGTSAGAINALLVGLNYSAEDTRRILFNMDFNAFMDDQWGVLRDLWRLIRFFGWNKGDVLRNWFGDLVAQKTGNPNSTFKEIHESGEKEAFRALYFVGTNLSTGTLEVFSYENTPDMPIADAVRISMSIPLYFAAVRRNRQVFVDGGVLNNYPVKMFDRASYVERHSVKKAYYEADNAQSGQNHDPHVYNCETLGFRLDSNSQIKFFVEKTQPVSRPISNVMVFLKQLIGVLLNAQDAQHLHSDDWQRTIYIDTLGIGTTEFSLTEQKKQSLIESGKKGAAAYFKWYDDPQSTPANRV
ncbi:patatin-like phospholipase family protein [bacterium]|nr:patatin-like phospholipase family protein [bacterium]